MVNGKWKMEDGMDDEMNDGSQIRAFRHCGLPSGIYHLPFTIYHLPFTIPIHHP